MEKSQNSKFFIKNILKAFVPFFQVSLIFFVLTITVWKKSLRNLNSFFKDGIFKKIKESEFLVVKWILLFLEALVFISFFLGIAFTILYCITVYRINEEKIMEILASFYVAPLFISFFKEVFYLFFVKNLEKN